MCRPAQREFMHPGPGVVLDSADAEYDLVAAWRQLIINTGGTDNRTSEQVLEEIKLGVDAIIRGETAGQTTLLAIFDKLLDMDARLATIATNTTGLADAIGTHDAAAPSRILMQGEYAETTVPAAVADGDAVRPWYEEFGRQMIFGANPAQAALDVSDVSPAQMQVQFETGWSALTAPGTETPARNVQDFENHTIEYIIATIDTSVDLIIWGTIDGGTTWFPMWSGTVLAADDQTDSIVFTGAKVEQIKCEFDGEVGGVAAVVTFKMMNGN